MRLERGAAIRGAGILLLVLLSAVATGCNGEDINSVPEASYKQVLLLGQDGVDTLASVENLLGGKLTAFLRVYNNEVSTPSLGELLHYDAVLAWTDGPAADPVGLGDVLADYVDAGGRVAIASFGLSNQSSLLGRILTSAYTPLAPVGNYYANDVMGAVLEPTHPIMSGVASLGGYYRDETAPNPGALVLATWATTTTPVVAVNATGTVVGISMYPTDLLQNTGDYPRLFANALRYLANR